MDMNSFISKKDPSRSINIQIEKTIWTSLKNLKQSNETFNDVISRLLNKRSKELSNSKIGAIEYKRKTWFMSEGDLGVQCEYNDIKSLSMFTLDLKFKKIFFENKSYNPSEFFGISSNIFYISEPYLFIYLAAIGNILHKEFNINVSNLEVEDLANLVLWRKLYYDYSLSEESFLEDIETPLRNSEDGDLAKKFSKDILKSPSLKAYNVLK